MGLSVTCKENKGYVSVYCATGFTHGRPYLLDFDSTAAGPIAAAPATSAVYQWIGVPQGETTVVAGWYPFQISGVCEAIVDGASDSADGGFLEVINSGTAFIFDHDTVRSVTSAAINSSGAAIVTSSSSLLYKITLLGDRVNIAGS